MSELYESDYHAWTLAQVDALRRRSANEIDWDNLLEEVDALAKSERRELRNRIRVLQVHILKWRVQTAFRSRSWWLTIKEQRRAVDEVLRESPSLHASLHEIWADAYASARRGAVVETGLPLRSFPVQPPFDLESAMSEPSEPELDGD